MSNGAIGWSYQRYYAWLLRLGLVRSLLVCTAIAIMTSVLCTAAVMLLLPDSRHYFWYNMIVAVASPLVSAPGLALIAFAMVYKLDETQTALTLAAETDPLTGVANRRHFMRQAERAFADAQAGGPAFAVVMLDIDHFKAINDTHGHGLGDQVLIEVAQACRQVLRPGDCFARFGGEEFVALLRGTSGTDAVATAETLRRTVATLDFEGLATTVTVSLGVASHLSGSTSLHDILNEADRQLYAAKAAGRNRVMAAADAMRLAS